MDDNWLSSLWRRFSGVEGHIATEVSEDTLGIFWYGRRQVALAIEFLVELVCRLQGIREMRGLELRDPYAGGIILLSAKELPTFVEEFAELLVRRSLEEADLVIEPTARTGTRLWFEGGGGAGSIVLDVPQEYQDKHLGLAREVAFEMERKYSIEFRV